MTEPLTITPYTSLAFGAHTWESLAENMKYKSAWLQTELLFKVNVCNLK